jgi:hypothetical protein
MVESNGKAVKHVRVYGVVVVVHGVSSEKVGALAHIKEVLKLVVTIGVVAV